MEIISEYFTDIGSYNDTIKNWDLNYKLLSKNNFSAEVKMIYNDDFSLARERLNGIIEHKGKTLEGFIVFAIPVNSAEFYWYEKKVTCKDLLIFSKDNSYKAISFDKFDVYIVSIRESIFYKEMGKLATKRFKELYWGEAQNLFLNKNFSNRFTNMLEYFLNTNLNNPAKNSALIKSMIFSLTEYLGTINQKKISIAKSKKDISVKKASEIINNNLNEIFSMAQLCAMTGVSERTLRNGFNERYNVSPKAYIKSIKLNKVRQEIYSNNTNLRISEIAGKYNFWHMGQFAKDFKNQFGILPSKVRKI